MKQIYLIALLWCGCILGLSAQSKDKDDRLFRAGLVAGFNASQLDGDDIKGYDKLGLHLGLQLQYGLNERVALGMEMLYSMKGSSQDLSFSSSSDGQTQIKLDYMEIPLWVSYHEWKLDFQAGAAYSRLISASTTSFTTSYAEEDFRGSDISLFLGAAYRINDNWALNLRWGRSLMNAIKKDIPKDGLNGHWITFRIEYLL